MSIIIQSELTGEVVALLKLTRADGFELVVICRTGEQIQHSWNF